MIGQLPPTRREEVVDHFHSGTPHGAEVSDPYRWLEDGDAPEVRAWVQAQNEHTRQLIHARPDRSAWHRRVTTLLRAPVVASTQVAGEHLFVLERPEGAEQLQLVRRSALDPLAPAQVLVDTGDPTSAIDWFQASPDGRLVAYGVSAGGTEASVLHVVDTASGTVLDDRIPHTRAASIAWDADGGSFWYTRYPADDEYHRRVYRHHLGQPWADDQLVWGDLPTPEAWPEVYASPDGRYLLVEVMVGWGHIDVHLLDRHGDRDVDATDHWRPVITGHEAISAFTFVGDHLVGMTTLDAGRGRLVVAPVDRPDVEHWRTLVPERDVVLSRPVRCGDELLVVATHRAVDQIERYALDGAFRGLVDGLGAVAVVGIAADPLDARLSHDVGPLSDARLSSAVGLPDDAGDAAAAAPADLFDPVRPAQAFITATGFTRPTATSRWRSHDGLTHWCGAASLPGLAPLTVSQVRYPSLDGTEVGLFLLHAAETPPGPDTPAILNGYGGFAITETPIWSPMIAAWCAAGGLYAIAGLRGGHEEGEAWHHAGRRGNKQNVFDDFHAAADWLVDRGLTSRDRLGIAGGSNGGLLVATALTQRPDAYRAVWCAVPLTDMIRFPQFLIARLWTDEYGDPAEPEEFAWLHAYSPYHRVEPRTRYPAVLLTTAEGDTRVDPLHARKMAAALQWAAVEQDDPPVLLHQEGQAGHGVGKPVGKRADEAADVLAFMAWQLGAPVVEQ